MFDSIINIFNVGFTNPVSNVFVGLYQLFSLVGFPGAFGFAIIGLTVILRLVLYPFTTAQLKSAHKMQKVAPFISEIRQQHKDDKKRQQEEIMRLYREHGVNPAAGCLPLIVQLPIIFALYHVLIKAVNITSNGGVEEINKILYFGFLKLESVWNTSFFGIPLGSSPADSFSAMPLIVLLPLLTGVSQYVLSRMMMPIETLHPAPVKKDQKEDFQATFQKQSMYIFPIMIAVFSFTLPSGLSLYWITFTVFGILQQYILLGPGAAAPLFEKIKINGKKGNK